MTNDQVRRYIIMDTGPLAADAGGGSPMRADASFRIAKAGVRLTARAEVPTAAKMTVIDSIDATGPRLVEMPAEGELSLRLSMPGIKIVPEVFYKKQRVQFSAEITPRSPRGAGRLANASATVAAPPAGKPATSVTVTDSASGNGIEGAHVVAFTNFKTKAGYEGVTDAAGVATLNGLDGVRKIERAYVYPPAGYWGGYIANTTGAALATFKLDRIDLKAAFLLLKQLYGGLPADAGNGVSIAVIDTGVADDHPDLPNVAGGLNCVSEEVRQDETSKTKWTPATTDGDHGTHVAGIAAGRGTASGFRGVAPGATIRSYRVFPDVGGNASNYDIINAIRTAVADGCHIINMSLGGGDRDDAVQIEIDRALEAGVVVIVAAGNDGRQPVAMPAALPGCVAVSAMGRETSFPTTSNGRSTILDPKGVPGVTDFIADFSNIGPEIDIVGPGVEIVSTLPTKGYGAMDGTSMAAPAVAGFAAYLLSANPAIMAMKGADRSRALKDLLYASCKPQGFGRNYEGFGLPLPPTSPAATV